MDSGREHLGKHYCVSSVVILFLLCFLCYPTRAHLFVVVCVSVQERMVDALASGADEGRGNLR